MVSIFLLYLATGLLVFLYYFVLPSLNKAITYLLTYLLPFIAACRACTKLRGYASSCVQGAKSSNAITRLQHTSSSFITVTKHGISALDNQSTRKWKRSVLLLLSLGKLFQFWGALLVGVTLLHIPLLLLDRALLLGWTPYTHQAQCHFFGTQLVEYDLTVERMFSSS